MRSKIRIATIVLALLVVVAVAASPLSNLGLPTHSEIVERLSAAEKARLAEALHLRESLGDQMWTGWGRADIPLIVYNESYAFLVGYAEDEDPPAGWVKVPHDEERGGEWERVPDDTFQGRPYYRQRLPDPDITPESFTVRVGDHWAATMQTSEYAKVAFFTGFRSDLPPFLRPIVPYRLIWELLLGATETYVGGLAHESFHAYQGMEVPERLALAEFAARLEGLAKYAELVIQRQAGAKTTTSRWHPSTTTRTSMHTVALSATGISRWTRSSVWRVARARRASTTAASRRRCCSIG